jgi:hypothetical protein
MKTRRQLGPKAIHRLRSRIQRDARVVPPKKNPAVEMFRETGLPSSPISDDPLWMSSTEYDTRQSVMSAVRDYEESVAPCGMNTFKVMVPGLVNENLRYSIASGDALYTHDCHDVVEWQRQTAYRMLCAGADIRHVAKRVYRPVEWCQALKAEFQIQ